MTPNHQQAAEGVNEMKCGDMCDGDNHDLYCPRWVSPPAASPEPAPPVPSGEQAAVEGGAETKEVTDLLSSMKVIDRSQRHMECRSDVLTKLMYELAAYRKPVSTTPDPRVESCEHFEDISKCFICTPNPVYDPRVEEIRFRSIGDPEANGRAPQTGEQRYTLKFPLEDGRTLFLEVGREDMSHFAKMIAQMMVDDDKDGLPQSL